MTDIDSTKIALIPIVGAAVEPGALADATGWIVKPEGLCRGETCIPAALTPGLVLPDGSIDVSVFGRATEQLVVLDQERGLAAVGPTASVRSHTLRSLDASDLAATTLDGESVAISQFPGRKKLVVAFSSWCGCRHDLPAWQDLQDELGAARFQVIAVAVDENAEDVRPWVEEAHATFPVILDRDRTLTERFAITNVPTVIWIDESDQVVRPNDVAFGSDLFKDYHHVDSDPHHEALRRWVLHDELPLPDTEAVRATQVVPTNEQQFARLHFRIALELHRSGDADGAQEHFDRAGSLAPDDFTIRRAQLALRGIDPFLSDEFISLYEEWQANGAYQYGVPTTP